MKRFSYADVTYKTIIVRLCRTVFVNAENILVYRLAVDGSHIVDDDGNNTYLEIGRFLFICSSIHYVL